jgi:outer membrane immunogenic protein
MKKILLALSALAIGTAAASAADIAPKYTKAPPPPPPPPCIWCGFYIGLNGGWAGTTGGNNSFVASQVESGVVAPIFFFGNNFNNQNTSGGFGGGQIGYNWVFPGGGAGYGGAGGYGGPGGWLVGVEADIQGASLHRSSQTLFLASVDELGETASFTADSRLNWFGTLRGRLGFATGPVLFYGTGGLAFGGVENRLLATFNDGFDCAFASCAVVGLNSFNNNNNNTRWGWVAGVGIEWMFAPNWSLKGEYQYIDLGSVTQTSTALVETQLVGSEIEGVIGSRRVNERFNTVRIGVNYHFGGYGGPVGPAY